MASIIQWFVVINPTSGNGSVKHKWPKIKSLLDTYGFTYRFAFTSHPKHSIEMIHSSVYQGVTNFICVGGDGTIHNMVNGIMTQKSVPSSTINLGVIPIGTGNDWVKTHAIPKNHEKAIKLIRAGKIKCQDVGKIEFINNEVSPIYFNNLAGIGFDGFVVSKVQKYKSLGAISYLTGALLGLFGFKNFKATVAFNNEEIKTNALMILVGLCQYSGGGMQLTKNPDPYDGFFDISIPENFGKLDIVMNMIKLFNGKITNSEKVMTSKTNDITILVDKTNPPFIQADGELIGKGDFKASVIPKALSFYV